MSTVLVHGESPAGLKEKEKARAMTTPPPVKRARSGPLADKAFGLLAKGAALLTLCLLLAILTSLTISAWPAITSTAWAF